MSISDARKRLHSPVGLDIGSETPAEIALSIVSEIQAILSKSAGDVLKSPEIMELNVARF
jgi:xanthine/CO dehydrogenase XdhC/CoxF family maturation factor